MGVARSELWAPENTHKGNVTCCTVRRFLELHSAISYLEYLRQCRNNAATLCCTKYCDCESSCVTSPLKQEKRAHGLTSTSRMRTEISPGQWQPWTAVLLLLGISVV